MLKSQTSTSGAKAKKLKINPFEKIDVNKELRRLEKMLEELKVDYEQFFLAVTPFQPDSLHKDVRRLMRRIRKAPFKKQVTRYRLRVLEGRYHTYHDYWQRVLRQKEDGTYVKDVFKANMRERFAKEEKEAQTQKGAASKSMEELFGCYKSALEQQTGKKQNLDFGFFQKALIQQAKAHAAKHGIKKLSFQVVVKDGRVTVRAKAAGAKAAPNR